MSEESRTGCKCECDCDHCERLEALEAELDELTMELRQVRRREIRPRLLSAEERIEDVADKSDDAHRERAELRRDVEAMDGTVEAIFGVEDEGLSTPKKRAQDLRHALIRQADAKTDANAGRVSLHYKDVQDLFASIGHGHVHAPECYQAMDDAVHTDGFVLDEKTKDGSSVKAICVDIDRLPPGVVVRDSTNGETPSAADDGIIPGDTTNKL